MVKLIIYCALEEIRIKRPVEGEKETAEINIPQDDVIVQIKWRKVTAIHDTVDTFTLGCIKEYIGKVNSENLTKVQPYTVDMQMDGHKVKIEIDTGCSLTILNEETFKELRKSERNTKLKLNWKRIQDNRSK